MEAVTQYMIIALSFVVCTSSLCSILVWTQRQANKKPRIFLAVYYFLSAIIMFIRLLMICQQGVPDNYPVLPSLNLYGGLLFLLLLYLYPVEIVNPGWLTSRKIFLLFLPLIIATLVMYVIPVKFRDLSSITQTWEYITELNVKLRILMLFACIIPYSLILLFTPYNWKKSSVDCKWIRIYTVGVQGILLLYILFMLTGSILVSALHLTYIVLFISWVAYQELYLRLIPTLEKYMTEDSSPIVSLPEKSIAIIPVQQQPATSPLWEKLTLQMNEKELWRDPDLTLETLSNNLYTNRTTLSVLIQQQGYAGYAEFINRRRIEAFVEAVNSNKSINTQQLFYEVGFRSKSTALRNFRLYMGCTPGEYIQRGAELKNKSDNPAPNSSEK